MVVQGMLACRETVLSSCVQLGTKQSGEVLGDIVLPPWAKGCPVEFIRLHREVKTYTCYTDVN